MFVVDTNVLLYAADRAAPEHARAKALLDLWRAGPLPWYATWGILYEFMRVATHPRVLRRPWTASEAWGFVDALRTSPGFGILVHTPRHPEIAAEMVRTVPGLRGNLFHDAHTAIVMREHGLRQIYTRDGDFHRFRFLEVSDPFLP